MASESGLGYDSCIIVSSTLLWRFEMPDQLTCYNCGKVIIEDAELYADRKFRSAPTVTSKSGKTIPQPIYAWKEKCPQCRFDNGGMFCFGNHFYLIWLPYKDVETRYKAGRAYIHEAAGRAKSGEEYLGSIDDIFNKDKLYLSVRPGCLHVYR